MTKEQFKQAAKEGSNALVDLVTSRRLLSAQQLAAAAATAASASSAAAAGSNAVRPLPVPAAADVELGATGLPSVVEEAMLEVVHRLNIPFP